MISNTMPVPAAIRVLTVPGVNVSVVVLVVPAAATVFVVPAS